MIGSLFSWYYEHFTAGTWVGIILSLFILGCIGLLVYWKRKIDAHLNRLEERWNKEEGGKK